MPEEARIVHMALDIVPDFDCGKIHYRCDLSLCGGPARFALNRGLRAVAVSSGNRSIAYRQSIRPVWDHGQADVLLLECGEAAEMLTLEIEGTIEPYSSLWSYIRDTVNARCTLFRKDAFAYPLPVFQGDGGWEVRHDAFLYDITARVPEGYMAICGGWPESVREEGGISVFRYVEKRTVNRFDLVMGRYSCSDAAEHSMRFFYLEGSPSYLDRHRIENEAAACVRLFEDTFDILPDARGLAAIEIPDGMGGQAGDGYFLQQTRFFIESGEIDGVYHEIAHGWTTARAVGAAAGKRFFDEAIASYLQVFALRRLHGQRAAANRLECMRGYVANALQQAGDAALTTLARHGGSHRLAYNKGAWMLQRLEWRMGETLFLRALEGFMHTYHNAPADFVDFQRVMQAHSKDDLREFFDMWLYSGDSTLLLLRGG